MVTMRERLLVASFITSYSLYHDAPIDDGKRGEVEQLLRAGEFDEQAYNRAWSSSPGRGGLFERRLRAAVEFFGKDSNLVRYAAPHCIVAPALAAQS